MAGFSLFTGLTGGGMFLLLLASAWTLVWKGLGLWFSAQEKRKGWFVVMLVLNTLGLLPIIYLVWFKKKPLKLSLKRRKKKR